MSKRLDIPLKVSLLLALGIPLSLAIPLGYYYGNPLRRYYYGFRFPCPNIIQRTRKPFSHFSEYFKNKRNKIRCKFQKRMITQDVYLFNGKVAAKEAFKWDLPRVLGFLGAAGENPGDFGVHPKHHSLLKAAVDRLEDTKVEKTKHPEEIRSREDQKKRKEKQDPEVSRNHIFTPDSKKLDVRPFNWEGVDLPCYSQYDLLKLVLSILGRAPRGATRRNHHLALLIICAKFFISVARENPKRDAPYLASIMFANEDEGESTMENADSLEDSAGLNVLLGATIPWHRTLKDQIRIKRYEFMENVGHFYLPGKYERWWFGGKRAKYPCGQCAETFGLVLLKRMSTLRGRTVGGMAIKLKSVLEMEKSTMLDSRI